MKLKVDNMIRQIILLGEKIKDSRGQGVKDSSEEIKLLKILPSLEPSNPGILEPYI